MQLCHREFKRSRLTAAEDVVNLSALVLLFVPALLYCGCVAMYGWEWLPLCYLPLIVGICSPIVSLLIIGAGISTLRRPTRIVANRWGLQFHFPFRRRRDLSWNQVRMGRAGRSLMRRSRGLVSIQDLLAITEEKTEADRAPMVLTTSPQPGAPVSSRNPIPLLVRPLLMFGALLAAGWMLLWGSPPYSDFSIQRSILFRDNGGFPLPTKDARNRIIRSPEAERTIYLMSILIPAQQASGGDLDGDIDVPPEVTEVAMRTDIVSDGYIQRMSPSRVHFSAHVLPFTRDDLLLTIAVIAPLSSKGTPSITHTNFSYILPSATRSTEYVQMTGTPEAPCGGAPCTAYCAGSLWSYNSAMDGLLMDGIFTDHDLIPVNRAKHIASTCDGYLYQLCIPDKGF